MKRAGVKIELFDNLARVFSAEDGLRVSEGGS